MEHFQAKWASLGDSENATKQTTQSVSNVCLSSRQKSSELRDFGFLRGDDAFREAPHFRVLAMAEHNARHVYRALVMRDHAGGEISIRIATEADIHIAMHLVIGSSEFARRGRFIRAGTRAVALMALLRQGREGKGSER